MKTREENREPPTSSRTSLELLYRVSREVATTLDLCTVLQRILSLSMETIGATSGSIIIINDQGQPIESAIIVEDRFIHHNIQQLEDTLKKGLAGWVINHEKPVHLPDTSVDERWLRRPDDQEEATGAKSAVSVPIQTRDKIVGVATFVHSQPHYLTTEHLSLVQAIADQAGVAVQNARLYEESQKQARVMTALAKSAKAISKTINLDEVLNSILYQIKQALQVELVTLALIDGQTEDLIYQAVITDDGPDESGNEKILGYRLSEGKGIAGWVAEHSQGMIINDAEHDPRYQRQLSPYQEYAPQAIVAAPIFLQDKVIGVLEAVNPRKDLFSSDALLVLSGIGSLAGSSIQNAQLFENLQEAHNRYHDIFENSPDPIIITDLDGQIKNTNNRTVQSSGFSESELRQMTISAIHEINRDVTGRDFSQLSGQAVSYESMMIKKNGEKIPVQVITHKTRIGENERLEWTFRDITEHKELDQLRDDMLSMIYHDLRAPLSNVMSSLDVIEASLDLSEDPDVQSLFDIAARSAKRIQRLTQSLLDINRLESGQPITDQVLVDPRTLINNTNQALHTQIQAKNITISTQIPENISKLTGDPDMLERVLINLVQNAVKFSPSESEIIIGVKEEENHHQFWVQDSGPGVDPQHQDVIFDKFKRLPSEKTIKGLGLGLAFCRLTIEGHGGRIWVENANNGGSVFSFIIPAKETSGEESDYLQPG